jgi:hypothetical protein
MMIRTTLIAALLIATAGCDQRAAFERLVPKDDAAFAMGTFDALRTRNFGIVEGRLDRSLVTAATRLQLEQMSSALGSDTPQDVRVIGASTNTVNGVVTYVGLTLEYRLSQRWLLASMNLHRMGNDRTIDAINVQPTIDSQERLNRFTFSGKGPANYIMLASTTSMFVFIVGTLVILWRTHIPRRRWLWVLFVAIGIGQFTLNWTTGRIAMQTLQVSLLGAGFTKPGPYAPWFLSVAVPVGAVIFLVRRRRWLADAPQPTSGSKAI